MAGVEMRFKLAEMPEHMNAEVGLPVWRIQVVCQGVITSLVTFKCISHKGK